MLINVYLWKSEKAKQTRVALVVQKYILELIKYSGCFVYTGKCLREEKNHLLDKSEGKCNIRKLFLRNREIPTLRRIEHILEYPLVISSLWSEWLK